MFEKKVALGLIQGRAAVFKDKQNVLWVATGSGIMKISSQKNHFEIIDKRSIAPKGNSIRGIYQDDDYFWWGGYTGNHRRNLHTGKTENFLTGENATVPLNFLKDDEGRLWIGSTHKIYFQYLPKEDKFIKHLAYYKKSLDRYSKRLVHRNFGW